MVQKFVAYMNVFWFVAIKLATGLRRKIIKGESQKLPGELHIRNV